MMPMLQDRGQKQYEAMAEEYFMQSGTQETCLGILLFVFRPIAMTGCKAGWISLLDKQRDCKAMP
jgi:hypothetical protein